MKQPTIDAIFQSSQECFHGSTFPSLSRETPYNQKCTLQRVRTLLLQHPKTQEKKLIISLDKSGLHLVSNIFIDHKNLRNYEPNLTTICDANPMLRIWYQWLAFFWAAIFL